ncbi:MAG: sugar phosphate isomerase/epimerase family protein [Acetivibrionales bacterium]|jgi:sugar phosphate isomerase/epimerase
MKLVNSVCTTLYFPESRRDIGEFGRMARFLAGKGIECIEFYHDGDGRSKLGNVLSDTGLNGVYIAVIPSKESKLHLCDENEEGRAAAVKLFERCIDEAQSNGITELMMNSGRIGSSIERGLEALAASVEDLFSYAALKNYKIRLLLEPCDSHMDACQLIGPYSRSLAFLRRMHAAGLPLGLTLDSAHTVEEGEDFLKALGAVKPYCRHIHFANCYIKDKQSPLYGDKHLGFEYPDTEWTVPALSKLFEGLKALYPDDNVLRIGLEALCRTDDPYKYFDDVWDSLAFLHKNF